MQDFVNYQIKELLKHDSEWHYKEKDLDIEFVHYCEKYISIHGKLPGYLYCHLNYLFWIYHD